MTIITATAPPPPSPPASPPAALAPSPSLDSILPFPFPTPTSPMHVPDPVEYNEWRILPIATLTSIATVIGSGILALPVTLYNTPLPVFLILFTFSLLAQIAVVCAIIELLQHARQHQNSPTHDAVSTPYTPISPPQHKEVSLFSIAEYYLPNAFLRYTYFITTFLCFISILVSYGLAGPQAVWQLLSPGNNVSTPPTVMLVTYWTLGTVAVIFFVNQLLGVFGSFTVLKGGLFVGVVFIVALLPDAAKVATMQDLFADYSDWAGAAAPFLMSCVAIGGVANTTPVTFNLLPMNASKAQIARYRIAMLLAVFICYLLNVGWVLAVLQVVPREAAPGKPSLTVAYESGQISTVPLIAVLHDGYAVQGWVLNLVELIVEMFIVVSTGVSFFVCAAGMKSFVDGAADTVQNAMPAFASGMMAQVPKAIAYVMSFGSVLALIVANPDGFISVLTRFTSFTVNLQAGALMFVMLYYARKMAGRDVKWFGQTYEGQEQGGYSGAVELDKLPRQAKENLMWDGIDVEAGTAQPVIPLEMSTSIASNFITFGCIFFGFGCFLALLGPMLGVRLDARE